MYSQWLQETTVPTDRSITFPMTFPNAIFRVLLTHIDTNANTNYQDTVTYMDNSKINVLSESSGNDSQFVFVTGY